MSFQAMAWAVRQKAGSATGKAILLMLANRADEDGRCFPSQKRLATDCECSERTVRDWLTKFEEMGIVRRGERRREDGRRTSDEIVLAMDQIRPLNDAEEPPAGSAGRQTSPAAPSDFTGSICRAINYQVKHQSFVCSAREVRDEFETEFWPEYPHKVGKGQARTAWASARKKASREAILEGLRRYVASKPERIAWCNPATWLNGERWLDQPGSEPSSPAAPQQRTAQRSASQRVMDEIDRQFGDRRGADASTIDAKATRRSDADRTGRANLDQGRGW